MDVCYSCGKKFNETNVKMHGEHIIQQAIGGSLIENDILCLSCGEKLGKEVDVPFNKIFNSISTGLDIKKDRKSNNSKNKITGVFISGVCQFGNKLEEIDVIWNNFKVAPTKPFHKYTKENDKVIIYANENVAKNYKRKYLISSQLTNQKLLFAVILKGKLGILLVWTLKLLKGD